jgi:hypothetical protein
MKTFVRVNVFESRWKKRRQERDNWWHKHTFVMHAYLGPQAFFAHHINNIIITIELMAEKVFCALLYWQLLYKLSFFSIDFYINFFSRENIFPWRLFSYILAFQKRNLNLCWREMFRHCWSPDY